MLPALVGSDGYALATYQIVSSCMYKAIAPVKMLRIPASRVTSVHRTENIYIRCSDRVATSVATAFEQILFEDWHSCDGIQCECLPCFGIIELDRD